MVESESGDQRGNPASEGTAEDDGRSAGGSTTGGERDEDGGETVEQTGSNRLDADAVEVDRIAVLATGGAETAAREAATEALEAAGYGVLGSDRRAREYDRIQAAVDDLVDRSDCCAVVTIGGTGVTPDDRTIDAVDALTSTSLPGFGEAFRRQWADERGDACIGSRVGAWLVDDTPVFCLPGEPDAASLAARHLVAPEAAAIHRMASDE